MNELVKIVATNVREAHDAFVLSAKLSQRWTRSELGRGGRRVIRTFKRESLSGPPGIAGGQFKKGRHTFSFVNFGKVDDVTVGISRVLRTHEEGAVISPRRSEALYLSRKTGASGEGEIFATADVIKIPARTQFRMLIRESAPDLADRVARANMRATTEAFKIKTKRIVKGLG